MNRLPAMFLAMISFVILAGCSDDPVTPTPAPPAGPETPEALMADFRAAYAGMDIDAYDALLDDRFEFRFIDGEGPAPAFDKPEDVASTGTMFSGLPHTNPDGISTSGISSIDFEILTLIRPWTAVHVGDPYFGDVEGAKTAYYDARITVYLTTGTITVDTYQTFYAVPDDEGLWSLLGQVDTAGDMKPNEDLSWGNLKSLFR